MHAAAQPCNDPAVTQPSRPPAHPITDRIVQASELLSATEAAEALDISPSTLTRMVSRGALVPLRRDPLIFHADDVKALKRA